MGDKDERDWSDLLNWIRGWQVSERDESIETGRHFTGVDGNVITVMSEREDGSYFLNSVVVE